MDYEQLKAFVNNEIEPYLQNIEMWQCITTLGIKPFKDGNQWSFLYGDNIQDGICGFGDTIDRAAWDFYTNLKTEKEKQGEQKPTEKVEPKFKAGDIIRHKKQGFICKITAVDTEYRLSGGTHLPFDFQDAWELVEQKPAELAKGEDYGIDGLYAAVDILQKTLGNVDGYQTDDGILEHKCAIAAVNKLYKQKPAEWSEEDKKMLDKVLECIRFAEDHYQLEEEVNGVSVKRWLLDHINSQTKQEWSKEDEYYYGIIQYVLNNERVGKQTKRMQLIGLNPSRTGYSQRENGVKRIVEYCIMLKHILVMQQDKGE